MKLWRKKVVVKKTSDYTMFKILGCNAEIKPEHVQRILDSIKIRNMLHARPILVNKDYEVIDGQHRLRAAELLGLEIYYEVDEQIRIEDMVLLNSNSRVWKPEDYIRHYAALGYVEYKKLENFLSDQKMNYNLFYRLRKGGKASGYHDGFKKGTFKFVSDDEIELFKDCLDQMAIIKTEIHGLQLNKEPFIYGARFSWAILTLIRKDGFKLDVFLNKVAFLHDKIHKCVDAAAYLSMLVYIYNYRNSLPIE